MAEIRIKLEVDGKAEFDHAFIRLDARISDLRPIWEKDLLPAFQQIETEQFNSEGGAGSTGKWKALSKKYAARKLKMYGAKPILEATGRLRRSLTTKTSDSIFKSSPMEVEIGSSVPYGIYHQRGGGKLPQRKVIGFSETQRRDLSTKLQIGMLREIKRGNTYLAG